MKRPAEYGFWASDVLLRRAFRREPPSPLERLGSEYGGYEIPTAWIRPEWMAYSVGIGEDATFDLELMRRFGCRVRAFDPTPRAVAYVRSLPATPLFDFRPVGIWTRDGDARFFAPRDPTHVSHSVDNLQATADHLVVPVRTLATVVRDAGDTRIDLLKLDVEGAEYAVLGQLLSTTLRPSVICAELHSPSPARNAWLALRLRAHGYRLASVRQPGPTVTFLRG